MKKFFLLSCFAFALALSAQEVAVPADLAGWSLSNKKNIAADKSVKLSGECSLRVENASQAIKVLTLEKGKKYQLAFYIKGEKLDKGARIILNSPGVKRWYPVSTFSNNKEETGTFDWKKGTYTLDTGVLGGGKVAIIFKNYGSGRVWFDKVSVVPIPEGWNNVYRSKIALDDEIRLSESSWRMEGFGQLAKRFDLEEGVEYEITFYLKGEKIENTPKKGAQLLICGGDRKLWARVTTNASGTPETGTFDWKKGSRRFTSKYFKSKQLWILPTLNCKSGTAWFDKIELKKVGQSINKSSFRNIVDKEIRQAAFYPGGVAGYFTPGEKILLNLALTGKKKIHYSVQLKKYKGGVIGSAVQGTSQLPGKIKLEFPGLPSGYYTAEARLFDGKNFAGSIQCGIIVAEEIKKRDPFFQFGFGVYPHLFEGYKRAGAGAIALKLKCMDLAMSKDPVKFVDRELNFYKPFLDSKDFLLLWSIGATLRKSSDPEHAALGRPILTDEFVNKIIISLTHVAQRTKGKIKEWSVGSEIPSNATMPRYVGTWTESMFNAMVIVRMASRIAKKADPEIKVFSGGNNIQRYTQSIEKIVFGDLVREVDGYFIDAYTGNWDMTQGGYSIPERSLRSFYAEASELSLSMGKSKFIKNDETGYAINYGSPYDSGLAVTQAELTARTFILTKAAPVSCLELHMPAYRHPTLANIQDKDRWMTTIWKPVTFGKEIFDVPLPGGAAYTVIARHLAFAKIRKEVVRGSFHACIFTKPCGKTFAAIWNTEAKSEVSLSLPQKAKLIDMVGFESSLKSGKNVLTVSTAPLYIECDVKPQELGAMLDKAFAASVPELKVSAKRGSLDKMTLFVHNPGGDLQRIKVRADGKIAGTFNAAPGLSKFSVPVCGKMEVLAGDKVYAVPQDKTFIRVKRLNKKPVFNGSGSWLADVPVNKLRVPGDVYPKEALQPERAFFKSSFNPKGHNFAADYYLAYDKENLYIAVKADDKKHLNKLPNGYLWDGDSIQWVLTGHDIPPVSVRPGSMKISDFVSDCNYGLGLTGKGVEFWRFLGKTSGIKSYPAKITRKNGITFYELALPWKDAGFCPEKAQSIRFSLVVFDRTTEAVPGVSYYLAVTRGVAGGMDAGEYRLLVFEK